MPQLFIGIVVRAEARQSYGILRLADWRLITLERRKNIKLRRGDWVTFSVYQRDGRRYALDPRRWRYSRRRPRFPARPWLDE